MKDPEKCCRCKMGVLAACHTYACLFWLLFLSPPLWICVVVGNKGPEKKKKKQRTDEMGRATERRECLAFKQMLTTVPYNRNKSILSRLFIFFFFPFITCSAWHGSGCVICMHLNSNYIIFSQLRKRVRFICVHMCGTSFPKKVCGAGCFGNSCMMQWHRNITIQHHFITEWIWFERKDETAI